MMTCGEAVVHGFESHAFPGCRMDEAYFPCMQVQPGFSAASLCAFLLRNNVAPVENVSDNRPSQSQCMGRMNPQLVSPAGLWEKQDVRGAVFVV